MDGQQRLTTLFLLLLATLERVSELSLHNTAHEQKLIFNDLFATDGRGDDSASISEKCRLTPTYLDRPSFYQLMSRARPVDQLDAKMRRELKFQTSALIRAKEYFARKIQSDQQLQFSHELFQFRTTLLDKLHFTVFLLQNICDPHMAYESFARKAEFSQHVFKLQVTKLGKLLCSSDLIRNLVLGSVSASRQVEIYDSCWVKLEKTVLLTANEDVEPAQWLDNFFFAFTHSGNWGGTVSDPLQAKICPMTISYSKFANLFVDTVTKLEKEGLSRDEVVIKLLDEMKQFAETWNPQDMHSNEATQ